MVFIRLNLCETMNCKDKVAVLGSENTKLMNCWRSMQERVCFLSSCPEHFLLAVTGDVVLAFADPWSDQTYCISVFV